MELASAQQHLIPSELMAQDLEAGNNGIQSYDSIVTSPGGNSRRWSTLETENGSESSDELAQLIMNMRQNMRHEHTMLALEVRRKRTETLRLCIPLVYFGMHMASIHMFTSSAHFRTFFLRNHDAIVNVFMYLGVSCLILLITIYTLPSRYQLLSADFKLIFVWMVIGALGSLSSLEAIAVYMGLGTMDPSLGFQACSDTKDAISSSGKDGLAPGSPYFLLMILAFFFNLMSTMISYMLYLIAQHSLWRLEHSDSSAVTERRMFID